MPFLGIEISNAELAINNCSDKAFGNKCLLFYAAGPTAKFASSARRSLSRSRAESIEMHDEEEK
jgi:hypothetical protein